MKMYASIYAIIAAVIYMPSIIYICTKAMKQMAQDQEKIGFYQNKMFIHAMIVELISVVFIILAFLEMDKGVGEDPFVYLLVLLLIVGFSFVYLMIEYKSLKDDLKTKNTDFPYLKTVFPITIALMMATPIISFIILLIQLSRQTM